MAMIPSTQRRTLSRLTATDIAHQLSQLQGWILLRQDSGPSIEKSFPFSDFSNAMSFANAVAFLAQHWDHHPDLTITSQCCVVRYQTHDLGGLSTWDFECAKRIDLLIASAA
ncbi:MAG: 4a-hydroxytetrahydrobiopterin dehydratase [Rhodoferax sp.]|nr:4a-hydroxytetrahydrobiopterin dehydratase [Rhodoferax sp.]